MVTDVLKITSYVLHDMIPILSMLTGAMQHCTRHECLTARDQIRKRVDGVGLLVMGLDLRSPQFHSFVPEEAEPREAKIQVLKEGGRATAEGDAKTKMLLVGL